MRLGPDGQGPSLSRRARRLQPRPQQGSPRLSCSDTAPSSDLQGYGRSTWEYYGSSAGMAHGRSTTGDPLSVEGSGEGCPGQRPGHRPDLLRERQELSADARVDRPKAGHGDLRRHHRDPERKSSPAASACSSDQVFYEVRAPSFWHDVRRKVRTGPVAETHVGQCRTLQSRASVLRPQSQSRRDRQALRSAVDSTLSDHGSHGERAHCRRSARRPQRSRYDLRRAQTRVIWARRPCIAGRAGPGQSSCPVVFWRPVAGSVVADGTGDACDDGDCQDPAGFYQGRLRASGRAKAPGTCASSCRPHSRRPWIVP
jgi:hypothetical protein